MKFLKNQDKTVSKVVPSGAHFTIKPLVLVVVIAPVALLILGPIGSLIGSALATFTLWLMDTVGSISMAIMAGLHNVTVMFGVYYLYTPIMANEIAETGTTFVLSSALAGNYTSAGAAFAIAYKAQKAQNKEVGLSSAVTALLGVTEPALFGVLIRLKKPLIAASLAAMVTGVFIGIFKVSAYAIASPGILALPIYIGGDSLTNFFLAVAVAVMAVVLGFVFTLLIGFDEE